MAVSRAMRRLLRIRDLEEEQSRLTLESALGELRNLESVLGAVQLLDRRGRRLFKTSVRSGELPDRLAGLAEVSTAKRHAAVLTPRIAKAELDVAALRELFLSKRVERRQAETLIRETEAEDAIEDGRRSQQAMDDWYGSRLYRQEADSAHARRNVSDAGEPGPRNPEDEGKPNKT
jgi:hypothetical protein